VGTSNFTIQVNDSGADIPQSAQRSLSLTVVAVAGRNDSIATATLISNGTYFASLSPLADPEGGPANPDNDYYEFIAPGGSTVRLETFGDRLAAPSPVDTVLEVVDSAGLRLSSCSTSSGGLFTSACLNDDSGFGGTVDSLLYFRVPGNPADLFTFYVRVLDWSGSARPDLIYYLEVSGAN
jgi:hypothetical protein